MKGGLLGHDFCLHYFFFALKYCPILKSDKQMLVMQGFWNCLNLKDLELFMILQYYQN